jgi:hypothetical protein
VVVVDWKVEMGGGEGGSGGGRLEGGDGPVWWSADALRVLKC